MKQNPLDFGAFIHDGNGQYETVRPASETEILAQARQILESRVRGNPVENPDAATDYLRMQLADYEREMFGCLFLDTRHNVIAFEILFQGTIDSATVHPREVVKRALGLNAAAIIISHNHPSGTPEPSQADTAITRRIVEACRLVDIRVLDHIVVATAGAVSLASRGLV